MTALEFIAQCEINGKELIFPDIVLPRQTYNEVKTLLERLNGKWIKSINGFRFQKDIANEIGRMLDGEKININKQFQFFETPAHITARMVELAGIDSNFTGRILEPSAGRGAIVKAILDVCSCDIDVCELMPENRDILAQLPVNLVGEDFLKFSPSTQYDVIMANPPFTKNQDIIHLQKMYNHLKAGGVLVCITSTHWQHSNNKIEKDFRAWLGNKKHSIKMLPEKTFEKTAIKTYLIVINKTKTDNDFGFVFYSNGMVQKNVKSEIYGQTTAVGYVSLVKETGVMGCGDGTDYRLNQRELKYIKSI